MWISSKICRLLSFVESCVGRHLVAATCFLLHRYNWCSCRNLTNLLLYKLIDL